MTTPRLRRCQGQLRRTFSVILDAILLLSLCCLLYVLLGGHVRWTTSLFRVTMANIGGPLKVFTFTMMMKGVFGLTSGIFAALSRKPRPFIGGISSAVHQGELGIAHFLSVNKINIACSLLTLLGGLACLEGYLRYFPHTLPYALGNHIASGYHTGTSGIYRDNAAMKMPLMRPNYTRLMYFQGYYWHHQTDAMGFRNPVTRSSADVVLLGDSMIYGHGVEETSTVRHYLEDILKKPVVNLGIQGASIHQEYQVLKNFGLKLRPRFVFVFFLANDIRDLVVQLSGEDMQKFLNLAVDDHTSPYFEIPQIRHKGFSLSTYLRELYMVKAFDFLIKDIRIYLLSNAYALEYSGESLPLFQKNPRLLLAMRFHLYALRKIQHLAERHRFHFMNMFIYTGQFDPDEEGLYEHTLAAYCQTMGIPFYSLKDDIQRAITSGEEVFLKGDGHFAPQGARLVARILAQLIEN